MAEINQPAQGVPTIKQQIDTVASNVGTDISNIANVTQAISANWFTAEFDLPKEVKQGLQDFQKSVGTLAETLVTLLETLNQILEAVKVFVAAYANPIQTITKALIEQIQIIINDIGQFGLYITGDWGLFGWPLDKLRGGYTAYQQRMVSRLTDASDPTRPNVSDATYVLGIFFYISVDISNVYLMIQSIQRLLNLFSFTFTAQSLPACSPIRVRYGFSPNSLTASFSTAFANSSNPLTIANLEWTINRPSGINPILTFPLPPPQGFIVEVSTVPMLQLWADRVSPTQGGPVQTTTGNNGQPRETVPVFSDILSVFVMGGADLFSISPENSASTAYNANGTVKDGKNFYYLAPVGNKASSARIPIDLMKSSDGKTYYLQKTFKISQSQLFLDPAVGQYRYTLAQADLPHDAEFTLSNGQWTVKDNGPAYKYYLRVSAITKEVDSNSPESPNFALKYNLTTPPRPNGPVEVLLLNNASPFTQLGLPSPPVTLTFPSKVTSDFFVALKTALALLVLSRVDLKVLEGLDQTVLDDIKAHKTPPSGAYAQSVLPGQTGGGTGLELYATGTSSLFDQIVGTGKDKTKFFLGADQQPSSWAARLVSKIDGLADTLYKQMGNLPAIEKLVVEQTVQLRTLTLAEIYGQPTSFVLLNTTIYNSLKKKDKEGKTIAGDYFGTASSIFQANEAASVNPLTFEGLPVTTDDFPYLWYKTQNKKLINSVFLPADTPETPEIVAEMTKDGYVKGTASALGVGTGTDTGWFKILEQPAQKQLFQSEGFPVVWQALFPDLGQQPTTKSLNYIGYRTLLDTPNGNLVYQQAQLVLNVAAAVQQRSRKDGAWVSYRFGNSFLGGNFQQFLVLINNYIKAVNNAFAATVQVIVGYIEFLQARIRELQQFIKTINYYIQQISLLVIPKAAMLITISPGTQGTLSSFLSAGNKPQDGPVSYGAGLAVVVPVLAGTKFLVDIITAFTQNQASPQSQAG